MSYIDVTGKTEDEAISNALRQLGLERDDVSVQILERAKAGFLGLGSQPAKIRVTYGPREEEETPVIEEKQPEPVKEPVRSAPEKKERKPERKPEKIGESGCDQSHIYSFPDAELNQAIGPQLLKHR